VVNGGCNFHEKFKFLRKPLIREPRVSRGRKPLKIRGKLEIGLSTKNLNNC